MSAQESDNSSSAAEFSRQEIRSLIAALREVGLWTSHLDGNFPDSATVDAMIKPILSDPARLRAVRESGLGGKPSADLDRMAKLAALALGTPYAAVTLVSDDAQTVAGSYAGGAPVPESVPLQQSMSKFAVASGEPFFIEDARHHPLSLDNPLVQAGALAAFAGVPLIDRKQQAVGALACWDIKPRLWTTGHMQVLGDLASVVQAKMLGA